MYSNEPIRYYKNRRTRPDPIVRWLQFSSIMVWFTFLFNVIFILNARPVQQGLFERFFNVSVRTYWDAQSLLTALIISLVQFLISIVSIYLNTKRMKRKYDIRYISHHVSAGLSLLIIIILAVVLTSWNA
ncbi:hypothetical protein [Thermoclostridium caenicola]|uniref:Uncharacterized protein n=1 Tax=Thermoclostridium caenicola TaxID=659425 RepID=A0A1M6DKL8_9FIRM|nr:hypothetical protein [Thermoclostridium caenicola]SHI73765.1 hypothetical protein SAMN05444373_100813 [Thermoclostridium caenicola]